MKSLLEFIRENSEKTTDATLKKFTFNFSGFEGAKEAIEAMTAASNETLGFTADEEKVSFTLSKENYSANTAFITALKDYVKKLGNDTVKRGSDSQYADKVHKLEDKIKTIDSTIESFNEAPAETKEDTDDKECKDGECKKDEQE